MLADRKETALIHETFTSFQGSGLLCGRRQFFIRFAGCAVKCPIRDVCDEPLALTKSHATAREIVGLVDDAIASVGVGGWIQITGGEPLNQPEAFLSLCDEAKKRGMRTHVQTSGLLPLPCPVDFLTVSPKSVEICQRWANELVLVNDPRWVTEEVCTRLFKTTRCVTYYLQPLWDKGVGNTQETVQLVERLNQAGMSWRVCLQIHKYLGVK